MTRIIITQNGKRLEIEDNSLNSGGQGGIHKILSPGYANYIAKIYHDENKALALEKKLQHMVKFSPCKTAPSIIRQSLAWAESALYQNNRFVGYLMPQVKNAIELTELTTPRSPHHRKGLEWRKFDISNTDSFKTRLIICYNISKAVELLHKSGMYTLVDLKPDNIMVNNQGIITIIDLDSIQVTDNKGILRFNADVCTEEFSPPEFYNQKIVPKSIKIDQSWDIFSFAVVCYKILFAIHPYQASHEKYSMISELIMNGYFVHGNKKSNLRVIPHIHNSFNKLPQSIRELFFRTFNAGHSSPANRPYLSEWVTAFSNILFSQTATNQIGSYSENYRNFSQGKPKVSLPANIQLTKIYNENDVQLKWFTLNSVHCELNGKNIGLKGSVIVPLQNKSYTFSITGQDGSTISKRINVKVPAPKIESFSISKVSNGYGVLQWNVSNAVNVLLNGTAVPRQGKQNINLYLPYFTLVAENKDGQSVKKIVQNPIWGNSKHVKIKFPTIKINQTDCIINSKHQIQLSGQVMNKIFAIHSKF